MNDRDQWTRDRLAHLAPPPRRAGFEEELWERAEAQQRRTARRWRLTSVALAALALAAIAAAAVVAATRGGGSTVDRTVSCATQQQGGLPVFGVLAGPTPPGFDYALLTVSTGGNSFLLGIDTRAKGFTLDGTACKPVRTKVPLAHGKLPFAGTSRRGEYGGGIDARCLLGGRVLLHLRLHLDGAGKPQSATLAVRMQRKSRPVAFVQWSPKLTRGWVSTACEQQ